MSGGLSRAGLALSASGGGAARDDLGAEAHALVTDRDLSVGSPADHDVLDLRLRFAAERAAQRLQRWLGGGVGLIGLADGVDPTARAVRS